jgi:hypothetical protein
MVEALARANLTSVSLSQFIIMMHVASTSQACRLPLLPSNELDRDPLGSQQAVKMTALTRPSWFVDPLRPTKPVTNCDVSQSSMGLLPEVIEPLGRNYEKNCLFGRG